MYRNILVAVDHSDASDRVLDAAAGLAQALNARLTILTLAVPPSSGCSTFLCPSRRRSR